PRGRIQADLPGNHRLLPQPAGRSLDAQRNGKRYALYGPGLRLHHCRTRFPPRGRSPGKIFLTGTGRCALAPHSRAAITALDLVKYEGFVELPVFAGVVLLDRERLAVIGD